jgi:hypothetical protein
MTPKLTPSGPPDRTALTALLAGPLPVAIAVIGCAAFAVGIPAVPDHAYQFDLARQVLDGAVLYQDVAALETRPPLFIWMGMLFESLARPFAVSGLEIYPYFVAALAAATIALAWQMSPRSPPVLAIAVLAIFPLSDAYFGQGEHFAVLCTLPYLFAASRDQSGGSRGVSIGIAILAAFGMAMKPHFALIWVVAESHRAWRLGYASLLRPESVVIGTLFVAYVLVTAALYPQFFAQIPRLAQLYPNYFPRPISVILLDPRSLLPIAALLAAFLQRSSAEWMRVARLLALAAAAMYLVMLLQQKGWGYHWYPVVAFSMIAISTALHMAPNRIAAIGVPVASATAIVLASAQPLRTSHLLEVAPTHLGPMAELAQRYAEGRPVVALSQHLQAGFPLAAVADIEWPLPYASMWMIRAIHSLPPDQAARWREFEAETIDRVWSVIETSRPAIIIVDRPGEGRIDMRAYFEKDARYRHLFARATVIGNTDTYDVYALDLDR